MSDKISDHCQCCYEYLPPENNDWYCNFCVDNDQCKYCGKCDHHCGCDGTGNE